MNIVVGILLQAGGFAWAFILNDWAPLIIAAIVMTIGEIVQAPATQTLRANLTNPNQIGVYSGFSAATRPVARVVAGLLVSASPILSNVGVAIVLLVIAVVAVGLMLVAERV